MRINILSVLFKIYFKRFKTGKIRLTSGICMSESESLLCDDIRVVTTWMCLWVAVAHLANTLMYFTGTVHPQCLGGHATSMATRTSI